MMNNVGYKGASVVDIGYYYCPYIPGQPVVQPEWNHRASVSTPTEMQLRIMGVVRFNPMLTNVS